MYLRLSALLSLSFFLLLLAGVNQKALAQQIGSGGLDKGPSLSLETGYLAAGGGASFPTVGFGFQTRHAIGWPVGLEVEFDLGLSQGPAEIANLSVSASKTLASWRRVSFYGGAGPVLSIVELTGDSLTAAEAKQTPVLKAGATSGDLDVGVHLNGGVEAKIGNFRPYLEVEGIAGDKYQTGGITLGVSVSPSELFSFGSYDRSLSQIIVEEPRSPNLLYTATPAPDHVPIYVHLQVHESPIERYNTEQSLAAVGQCQRAIYQNVVALAKRKGATAVVGEGLSKRGSWKYPVSYGPDFEPDGEGPLSSVVELIQTKGINVYGFESSEKNDLGMNAIQKKDRILSKTGKKEKALAKTRRLETIANLLIASRSFDALSMAYRAATTTQRKGAQLVIGAGHWEDFKWLAEEKEDDFYIRLFGYRYEDCD
jgi:hypothetical protein